MGDSDIPCICLVLLSACLSVIVGDDEDVGSFKDEPSCPILYCTAVHVTCHNKIPCKFTNNTH